MDNDKDKTIKTPAVVVPVTEAVKTQEAIPATVPVVEVKAPEVPAVETKPALDKNQLLREMSKEYGVNLYSAEGLAEFKKFQDANKTEQEKLQDQLNSLTDKETEFKTKEESYQATIAALQLGISEDKLDDALALAKINMTEGQSIKDGLAAVKAKYGETFSKVKSTKTEVIIGTQQNDSLPGHVEIDPVVARLTKLGKLK